MANVEVYTKETCPYCHRVKTLLSSKGVGFQELSIGGSAAKREEMIKRNGHTTVPQIFIDAQHIGGCSGLYALDARGGLDPLLKQRVNVGVTLCSILGTTLKGFLHMSEQNSIGMASQVQRVYTKDTSFETPNAPHVFQKDWQPKAKLDLDTASSQLADDVYEVVLRVTVTASLGEETASLCEVQQDGIFSIAGIGGTQMVHCLGAYCPNILFPYARECITNMVSCGTFPQLSLAPVNSDVLSMNYLQQQAGEGTEEHQDA